MNGKNHSAALSRRVARISGAAVIVFLWFIVFATGLAGVLEFGGISRRISDKWYTPFESPPLYRTDYYGKPLEFDPYKLTSILYLHPYYLFSLPWRQPDRELADNDYVHLDKNGFRTNPNLATAGKDRAVLLGGSTAFGKFSSSDLHTIAAELTARTGIGFVNRNAPAWNSHQELVALAKYPDEYELSVSFSLSNDMANFCKGDVPNFDVLDAPASFYDLQKVFDTERGRTSISILPGFSFVKVVRFLKKTFPDTARLIHQIDNPFGGNDSDLSADHSEQCKGKDVTPVVDAFLRMKPSCLSYRKPGAPCISW